MMPRDLPLPALALALAAALPAGCGGGAAGELEGPRNVILISLDTLRADAASLYGYEKPTTPFLEELAARGVVFDKHVVNSNNTLTSHTTMLTGLYQDVHQTYDKGPQDRRALAPEYVTLAERFQEAGYQTAMFTTHPTWLARTFGLDQGFEAVQSDWYGAAENDRRFLAWLDEARPRRLFAFLHYYDAHSETDRGTQPYDAPPEYLARFAPPRPADFTGTVVNREGETVRTSRYLEHYASPFHDLPPGHLEYLRGCYDAGVAKLDADLRDLFGELDKRGILDDALVVITADHGEEFKDHGRMLHMEYHEEIMRVPLLIVPPRSEHVQPHRVEQISRCIDIAPTLLDWAGLPPLPAAQGRSLAGVARGTEELPWADSLFGSGILRGRDDVSEFMLCNIPDYYAFYDLDADPGERHSLLGRKLEYVEMDPERFNALRTRMAHIKEENRLLVKAIAASNPDAPQMTPGEEAQLRSLGYFGDAPDQDD